MHTMRPLIGLVFGLAAFCYSCGSGQGWSDDQATVSVSALENGTPTSSTEGRWVVSLGTCTGVFLSRNAILTAGHCVSDSSEAPFVLSRGASGAECLGCGSVTLQIRKHEDVDLALLTSTNPLIMDSVESFPTIELDGPLTSFRAWGYGEGSYASDGGPLFVSHGSQLLSAEFQPTRQLFGELEARSGAQSVCDGDSGGPATVDAAGVTAIVGILHDSEAADGNPRCTRSNGRQSWVRPGAYLSFFEDVLGPCDRQTSGPYQVASCHGMPHPAKLRNASDGALNRYLAMPGSQAVVPQGTPDVSASDAFRVAVVTSSGLHDVDLSKKVLDDQFGSVYEPVDGKPAAPASEALFLRDRGWSQAIDNRFQITGTQAPEVGRLVTHFRQTTPVQATWSSACSATLIGARLIRTAAHCVLQENTDHSSPVWADTVTFELYRDGNSVGASVAASWYEIGGYYIPNNCWNHASGDPFRANTNKCVNEDWALLVLPQTAWNALGYQPAYMGYQGLTSGDLYRRGTAAGYPACMLDNSPISCPGTVPFNNYWKYADTNFDCEVMKFTSGSTIFRSGCDVSEGMSGGPFYDPNTRWLLANVSWQACTTCNYYDGAGLVGRDAMTLDDFYSPNYYLATNGWLFDEQNRLRSLYP